MDRTERLTLPFSITVNGHEINFLVIGRHYRKHHADSINDLIILHLVQSLDGKSFKPDSIGQGIEYYATDIQFKNEMGTIKTYRLIWLFEGDFLEVLGVINAYRVRKKKKI